MEIQEAGYTNAEDIERLEEFYRDIFVEGIPDEDKRETFENILRSLKEVDLYGTYNRYHILLAIECEEVVGGFMFDYFCNSNACVIEYMVVKKNLRGKGIGKSIYNRMIEVIKEDSKKAGYSGVSLILAEVDRVREDGIGNPAYIYRSLGFRRIVDFDYIQPPLSEGTKAATDLEIVVLDSRGVKEIETSIVASVILDHVKYAMRIKNPLERKEVGYMIGQLIETETLRTEELSTYGSNTASKWKESTWTP